jgi:hypothetical protein
VAMGIPGVTSTSQFSCGMYLDQGVALSTIACLLSIDLDKA